MSRHARRKAVRVPGLLWCLVLLTAPALGGGSVLAQTDLPFPSDTSAEIYVMPQPTQRGSLFKRSDLRQRMESIWHSRKKTLSQPDAHSGPASLDPLTDLLHRQGYLSVSGMEANLVYEARGLQKQQYLERAGQSLESALLLSPRHLPALSAAAEISLKRNPAKLLGRVTTALAAISETFWPAVTALTDFALLVLFTLLSLTVLLHLALLSRHQKQLRHSIQEGWRDKLPASLLTVAGWVILLLPLCFFFGPFWTFAWWIALLWRFAARSERLLAVLSLVLISFLVPAVDTVEGTYRDLNSGSLRLFSEALEQKLLSPRGEALLRQESTEPGSAGPLEFDMERRFLVASMNRSLGLEDQAFDRYAEIPVYHYLYPMAQNNIGNIFFSMNQFDLAIQHYRKALDVRPDYAECYFNLSSAQFVVYDFDNSDQALSRAQRLAPDAIGKLINEESRGLKTLDHRIPETFLWDLAWRSLQNNASHHFRGIGTKNAAPLVLLALALAAALAGFIIGLINRHEVIGLCDSCGRAFCRLCGPDPVKQVQCQQCTHLGSRMSGVSPEIRKQKLRQIQRHRLWNKIREGLMTMLMPGLRSLRRGQLLIGVVISGIWIFLVSALAALPTLLPRIGLHASGWSLNPLIVVLAVLAILFWSVNLLAWLLQSLSRGDWRPLGTVGPGTGGGEESS